MFVSKQISYAGHLELFSARFFYNPGLHSNTKFWFNSLRCNMKQFRMFLLYLHRYFFIGQVDRTIENNHNCPKGGSCRIYSILTVYGVIISLQRFSPNARRGRRLPMLDLLIVCNVNMYIVSSSVDIVMKTSVFFSFKCIFT